MFCSMFALDFQCFFGAVIQSAVRAPAPRGIWKPRSSRLLAPPPRRLGDPALAANLITASTSSWGGPYSSRIFKTFRIFKYSKIFQKIWPSPCTALNCLLPSSSPQLFKPFLKDSLNNDTRQIQFSHVRMKEVMSLLLLLLSSFLLRECWDDCVHYYFITSERLA